MTFIYLITFLSILIAAKLAYLDAKHKREQPDYPNPMLTELSFITTTIALFLIALVFVITIKNNSMVNYNYLTNYGY